MVPPSSATIIRHPWFRFMMRVFDIPLLSTKQLEKYRADQPRSSERCDQTAFIGGDSRYRCSFRIGVYVTVGGQQYCAWGSPRETVNIVRGSHQRHWREPLCRLGGHDVSGAGLDRLPLVVAEQWQRGEVHGRLHLAGVSIVGPLSGDPAGERLRRRLAPRQRGATRTRVSCTRCLQKARTRPKSIGTH